MWLFLFGTFLVVWLTYELYWKRRHLPPGPTPIPLIGNLGSIAIHNPGYTAFESFRRKYGPIYTFWFSTKPIIMVSEYKILKELFIKQGDLFAERSSYDVFTEVMRGGNYGIMDARGDYWRHHRRFFLHIFRDLGVGSHVAEQKILNEFEKLENSLLDGETHRIWNRMRVIVASLINSLLFGYGFDETNMGEYDTLLELIEAQKKLNGDIFSVIVIFNPILYKVPGFRKPVDTLVALKDGFFNFFEKQIIEHEREINYESEDASDYVEAYLKEKKKSDAEGDTELYSMLQLKNVCFDLWLAGFDTTTITLQWSTIFLANNLDVQERMREEMAKSVSLDSRVSIKDRPKLPYCQAVINESQRFLNLLIWNLMREAKEDVEIDGYKIPKGARVCPQISTVLYDDDIFPDSQKFKPDRFLDEEGNLKKVEEFLPFSIGRRQCPGESLARMELFLMLTNIIHKFKITASDAPVRPTSMVLLFQPPDCEFTFTPVTNL